MSRVTQQCHHRWLLLLIKIYLVALSIGGVSQAFAAERFIFEVKAQNNKSDIVTVFQVLSRDERSAREEVALNGWTVLSVKQLSYRQKANVDINVDDVSGYKSLSTPAATAAEKAIKAIKDKGLADNASRQLSTTNPDAYVNSILMDAVPELKAMRGDEAPLLSNIPSDDKLIHLYTVNYLLGDVYPILSPADKAKLAALPKDSKYYLFGHTDDVPVIPGSIFKDNFQLSYMRAEGVKSLLTELGKQPDAISTVGLGYKYPVVENISGGTLLNRRVEIYGLRP